MSKLTPSRAEMVAAVVDLAPPRPGIQWLRILGWTGAILLTLAFSVAFVAWVVMVDPQWRAP